jgi:hypothetical protein
LPDGLARWASDDCCAWLGLGCGCG